MARGAELAGAGERARLMASADLTQAYRECAGRGQNAPWRYLVAVPLGLVLTLALGLAVGLCLQLAHLVPADLQAQMRNPTRPVVFFAATGLIFGALLVGFAGAVRVVHGKRPSDLWGVWSWPRFGAGAAIWVVALCGLTLADLALAPTGFKLTAGRPTVGLALWALLGLAPQTFAEEFVFRGYLTQGLLNAVRRPWAAALISGLLFGALHVPNGWPQAVNATLFGVLLAWLAIRTGGLAFTFGLHLANNLFGAVVVVSAGDVFHGVPGVLTQATPQLMWWDTAASSVALLALTWALSRPAAGPAAGLRDMARAVASRAGGGS
jgi:membrane protease YdiL (CAAX protease family)